AARPIGQLVAAARRIEDGQYDAPVAVEGSEEFRRLAGTLNAMQQRVAEREARIRHQANHDALTGLPNRSLAEAELARRLASPAAAGAGGAVAVVVHLPNRRALTASLGPGTGAGALRQSARRLESACRGGELVARLGASRYLVLLGRPQAAEHAGRIAASLVA